MDLPQKYIVKQLVEMIEVFSNFETANKYSIKSLDGRELFYAYETPGVLFFRQILKTHRPIQLNIIDKNKKVKIILKRPFFFFFANYTVEYPDGKVFANIKQRFGILKKVFDIMDSSNRFIRCVSKIPHVWTFNITQSTQKLGVISKKWSGLGKEALTDADNFNIEMNNVHDKEVKKLILALAFAIDLRFFEKK